MRKAVYVILVLCCFIIKTYSINRPYYRFKQLSIKEGLPTSIISLYEDKNGSLWVGTTQGIYRFNGEKIKKYNLPYLLRKNSQTNPPHFLIYFVILNTMLSFTSVQNDKLYIISQFGYQYPLFALNFKTYFLYLY